MTRLLLLPLVAYLAGMPATVLSAFCAPATVPNCWPTFAKQEEWSLSLTSPNTTVVFPNKQPDPFLTQAVSRNLLKSNFPAIIVLPGSEEDLVSALKFAFKYGLRVVARCSGHDFNGRSTGRNSLLIKTERLNTVMYDNATQTVKFWSGANHAAVYKAVAEYDRVYVGGQAATVCPAGCLAGGCHGLLSRQYGLGADNIESFKIALYNGSTVVASRVENADLFHAYFGAGQNSLGVVLWFNAYTYPAPPRVQEINIQLRLTDPTSNTTSPNVLTDYLFNLTWWDALPLTLAGTYTIQGDTVLVYMLYTGFDEGEAAVEALMPLYTSPYIIAADVRNHTNLYELAMFATESDSAAWARKFITNGLVPQDQDALSGLADAIVAARPPLVMVWAVYGGAVQTGRTGVVSRGMRQAMYQVLLGWTWQDPNTDYDVMGTVMQYTPALYSIAPYSYNNEYTVYGSMYNTFEDWKTRFYENYDTVLATKMKYDPCNTFTVRYGIGSDLPTGTCRGK